MAALSAILNQIIIELVNDIRNNDCNIIAKFGGILNNRGIYLELLGISSKQNGRQSRHF